MNKLEQSADQEARHSHKERADRLVKDLHKVAEALVDSIGRVAELKGLLREANDRLADIPMQDDGQAYKEAEKFRERLSKALGARNNERDETKGEK